MSKKKVFNNKKVDIYIKIFIFILTVIISSIIIGFDLKQAVTSNYKVGEFSEINVLVPEDISYIQESESFINELNRIFNHFKEYVELKKELKENNLENLIIILENQMNQVYRLTFSDSEIKEILKLSIPKIDEWKSLIIKVSGKYLSGIDYSEIQKIQHKLVMDLIKESGSKKGTPFFVKVIGYLSKHLPIRKEIKKGDYLLRKGERIKKFQIHILKKLNIKVKNKNPYKVKYVGIFFITGIILSIIVFYFVKFQKEILISNRLFGLIFLVFIMFIFLTKISYFLIFVKDVSIEFSGINIRIFSPYFMPTACLAMIFVILFDFNFSLLMSIVMAFSIGLVFKENAIIYSIYSFIGSVFAVILAANFRERWQITRAGLAVSAVNIFMISTFYLLGIEEIQTGYSLFVNIFWGIVSGIFSSVIAIGGLPYFEDIFRITTSIKMLELIEFNQPLLKQLILDAPGTYHHSVIVSNLAEAAAREVGADPLLCKVGGYYHDIGKMKRPYFFVENQSGENVHDELSPNLSSLIIISHVKDGADLAKENKLPDSIIDIIRQHHGTSLVSYFYNKAKNNSRSSDNLEQKFRYPGPKPKTKEAAIIMLADSIESAARTLDKPDASHISSLISRIVNQKFDDGQMDSCEITLKNIETLEKVFAKILISMYHARIEYPQEINRIAKDKEIEGK